MLYLSGVGTIYPPGTKDPSFSGSQATVLTSTATMNSAMTIKTRDGDTASNWTSGTKPSGVVEVTLDLGRERQVTGVKWMTAYNGYADKFTVRLMDASYRSTLLGIFGNPGGSRTWYGVATQPKTARWVKFYFENPNDDYVVGSISEIQVFAADTTNNPPPPGTPRPGFAGSKLPVTGVTATMNGAAAFKMNDDNTGSNWTSGTEPDGVVTLTFDLGTEREITGVRWMTAYLGYLDRFTVRIMDTSYRSTTLGVFGNPTSSGVYHGVAVSPAVRGRWVKVYIENPNHDYVVGSIAELQIFGTGLGASSVPATAGTADPQFGGAKLPVVSSTASSNAWQSGKTHDGNPLSNWVSEGNPQAPVTLTYDLGADTPLTGVKWLTAFNGYADAFTVEARASDGTVTSLGNFTNPGQSRVWFGVASDGVTARYVDLVFTNPNLDPLVGSIGEVEIWGLAAAPVASPVASPQARPIASPIASPEASPISIEDETSEASPVADSSEPDASPVAEEPAAATPEVVEDESPEASPEVMEPATEPTPTEPVEEPQASPAVVVPTPTETLEPTATTEPTPTVEPTAAVSQAFISGTDGDLVNCRMSPVDGEVIAGLEEGTPIEVVGPAVDGWYPVTCEGQQGYISTDFVMLGTPEPDAAAPTATEPVEPTATEEPVVEETPYPVYDTGDTEQSGSAWFASDNDPGTWWSVVPSLHPEQVRLYFDLGSVVPIDRLTLNLATWDQLPSFEIWLSEDADIWFNATPDGIDGWNLERDVDLNFSLGFDARYVRIVIPNVPASGLGEVGGIRQIDIWTGDINETRYLTALGNPTTPEPAPVEPTATREPEEFAEPTEIPDDVIEPTATEEPVFEATATTEPGGEDSGGPLPDEEDVQQPDDTIGTPA